MNAHSILADLNSTADADAEGVVVGLVLVGLVTAAVFFVCGVLLKQAWAGLAAAMVFLIGALLVVL